MSYKLEFAKQADEDLLAIKRSGNKNSLNKAIKLLYELEQHPKTGTGKPEVLKGYDGTIYSRHVNHTDRLVYQILEEDKVVRIIQVLNHYQDK